MDKENQRIQPALYTGIAILALVLLFVFGAHLPFTAHLKNILRTPVSFIIILGVLVFVHELGHYVAAKRAGMRVHEFAIGMGPAIWSTSRRYKVPGREGEEETMYSLRAIPLGGYVRIAGMDPGEDPDEPGGFNTKPWIWRFVTLVAGCVMNFVLAALLFCYLGIFLGVPMSVNKVDVLTPNKPAALAGLKPGDEIIAIGNVQSREVEALREAILDHPGEPTQVTVLRKGQTLKFTLTPEAIDEGGKKIGRMGVQFDTEERKLGPLVALKIGMESTFEMSKMIVHGLGRMITGRIKADEMGGPVAIFNQTGKAAREGIPHLIDFAAMLSINLGILNLLPIPALDGGRIIFLLIEAVRFGRRIDPRKEAYVHLVGIVLLVSLMIIITYKDIMGLINKS